MNGISSLAPVQVMNKSIQHPVVLVVEDQPAIQDMLSWWLHLQGYQPACTANGQEALKWMEQTLYTQRYPQAILLDLFMPVMDGRQFLATLRARRALPLPMPPIILLTVERSNQDDLACNSVLVKPFHLQDLGECLRQAIKKCS